MWLGFEQAEGEVLMILDADLTVRPEDLPRFYAALANRWLSQLPGLEQLGLTH